MKGKHGKIIVISKVVEEREMDEMGDKVPETKITKSRAQSNNAANIFVSLFQGKN